MSQRSLRRTRTGASHADSTAGSNAGAADEGRTLDIILGRRKGQPDTLRSELDGKAGGASSAGGDLGASTERMQLLVTLTATWSPFRLYLLDLHEKAWFSGGVFAVIMLNTLLIALQTDRLLGVDGGWYMSAIDSAFLGVYVVELAVKLFVWRSLFWQSGWNVFDAVIVGLSLLEIVWLVAVGQLTAVNPKIFRLLRVFRSLRAIRALRVLRSVSFIKSLQVIVSTLLSSLPAMGSVMSLLFLVMYIFAIIGVSLYAEVLPERFGRIDVSLFSLFQMLTLDDWFGLYDDGRREAPTMIVFLVTFIVFESLILLNLFVAVIVSNLEQQQRRTMAESKRWEEEARRRRIRKANELAPAGAGARDGAGRGANTSGGLELAPGGSPDGAERNGGELPGGGGGGGMWAASAAQWSRTMTLLASLDSTLANDLSLHKISADLVDLASRSDTLRARGVDVFGKPA